MVFYPRPPRHTYCTPNRALVFLFRNIPTLTPTRTVPFNTCCPPRRRRENVQDRGLTREARLLLLEALAGATGRALGDVVFQPTGRGLTFPIPKNKKKADSASAAAAAAIAQPDAAWFASLRATARRAWGGGVEVDGDGGVDLESPPSLDALRKSAAGGFGGGAAAGGGGWVPVGARAAGAGRAEVDGEGALVPEFDARIAARMAQELFDEIAEGKEPGRCVCERGGG